jgi:hypothetical protein
MKAIELLSLGTCLLSQPIEAMTRAGAVHSALQGTRLRAAAAYCLDDALQFVRFARGEFDVPEPIRPLCDLSRDWECQPVWQQCRTRCEIALVEVYSPIRMGLGPYSLIRGQVINHVTDPLIARRDDMRRTLNSWWNQGLWAGKETIRKEAGEALAAAVDDTIPNHDMVRQVFREATPLRRTQEELIQGLATLRDLLEVPVAVVTPIHQYLPDGRLMMWPPRFIEELLTAARTLDLPVFQPTTVVEEHGIEHAWRDESGPYREEFWPVLGDALSDFVNGLRRSHQYS